MIMKNLGGSENPCDRTDAGDPWCFEEILPNHFGFHRKFHVPLGEMFPRSAVHPCVRHL